MINKRLLTGILIIWCISGYSQQVIPLYTGTPPGNLVNDDRETTVRPAGGRSYVTNVTIPTLTVFVPKNQNASRTAVIICPGGGYHRLSIEDGGYEAGKALAAEGITAFVLKYRTRRDSAYTDFREVPMQDLNTALKMINDGASKWNIDTTRIGVLGFSAGGHLTAMTATSSGKQKIAFTFLIYPVISFTDELSSKGTVSRSVLLGKKSSQTDKRAYSPELNVTASTPPAYLVHAQDDSTSLVGNSIAYYNALVANSISAQMLIYQKGGHGFAIYNKAQDEYWMPAAIKWLALNNFYDLGKIKK